MAIVTAARKVIAFPTAGKRTTCLRRADAVQPGRRPVTSAAHSSESPGAAWGLSAASVLSAAAVILATAPSSLAADLALGQQVFNGNCAACHMGGRNSVIAEKTLDKAALEQYLDGGFNLESIIRQVENGKGAMPAWSDRLEEDEIRAVAEYVYKQASEALWK